MQELSPNNFLRIETINTKKSEIEHERGSFMEEEWKILSTSEKAKGAQARFWLKMRTLRFNPKLSLCP